MPPTAVEDHVCTKCGQTVIKRGWFWVLQEERYAKRVTFCPSGGNHEVEEDDDGD